MRHHGATVVAARRARARLPRDLHVRQCHVSDAGHLLGKVTLRRRDRARRRAQRAAERGPPHVGILDGAARLGRGRQSRNDGGAGQARDRGRAESQAADPQESRKGGNRDDDVSDRSARRARWRCRCPAPRPSVRRRTSSRSRSARSRSGRRRSPRSARRPASSRSMASCSRTSARPARGETVQAVISGAADIGIGVGTAGVLRAFARARRCASSAPTSPAPATSTGTCARSRRSRRSGRDRQEHHRLFDQRLDEPQSWCSPSRRSSASRRSRPRPAACRRR